MANPKAEILAQSIESSIPLLTRYLPGFNDGNRTRQAPGLPNHVAWTLGHLAITMHRAAERLGGHAIASADFIEGAERGNANAFGTAGVGFGSTVTSDPAAFPPLKRCVDIFEAAAQRLAASVRGLSEPALSEETSWGQAKLSRERLAARMIFHNGQHTGQLMDLRRVMGMPRVVG